jgi:hypothetical protein
MDAVVSLRVFIEWPPSEIGPEGSPTTLARTAARRKWGYP